MNRNFSLTLKNILIKYSIGCAIIIIIIALCIIDTTLLSVRNIRNIVSDAAPLLLMASGMALCLFSGYIDLSAGAVAALSGVLVGSLVQRIDTAGRIISVLPPIPAFIVIPAIIMLFYAIGMLYGIILHKIKIPSWFFSLATSSVLMGIGYMYVSIPEISTMQISGFSDQFLQFGVAYIGTGPTYSIPVSIIISIITLTLLWLYLRNNKLELTLRSNQVERVNSKKNIKIIFGSSTALFALAGIMITARNGVATPTIGFGLTSDALTICLIAGFSLKGGKGNVRLATIATIVYTTLVYCITFVGINQYISLVIRGIILIGAVVLESHIQNHKKEASE